MTDSVMYNPALKEGLQSVSLLSAEVVARERKGVDSLRTSTTGVTPGGESNRGLLALVGTWGNRGRSNNDSSKPESKETVY